MTPMRTTALLAAATCLAVAGSSLPANAQTATTWSKPTPGGGASGDPYFPYLGNTGYDALTYHLDLDYTPVDASSGTLDATSTMTLKPTQNLSSFNLDLRGLSVSSVRVNGLKASFSQTDRELVVTPRLPLLAHLPALVTITYGGTTGRPLDDGGSLYGWVSTADGALVANEPDGAPTWYPVNDDPADKALYSFRITVPEGKTAVANGLPIGKPTTRGGRTTYRWVEPSPMASYLTTASIGDFDLTTSKTSKGLPIIDAVDRKLAPARLETTKAALAKQADMIDFFSDHFGPYPFTSFGAIVDDDSVGYALETQSRPIYSRGAGEGTVAHELAHQWYGDSVSPTLWGRDLWLNEGFATYAAWMWTEHTGGRTVADAASAVLARPATSSFWQTVVTDPGLEDLFASAVYDRGALTLFQLKQKIGDAAFATLLKAWAKQHRYGNATTPDFVALAEKISGQDLDTFFTTWLDTPGKPTDW